MRRARLASPSARGGVRPQSHASEQRSTAADDLLRQTRLNEQLSAEARNVDMARRKAEHSLRETKAELDQARRREQDVIQHGREIFQEQSRQLKETEDQLNKERESKQAIAAETERIKLLADQRSWNTNDIMPSRVNSSTNVLLNLNYRRVRSSRWPRR